MGGAVQFHAPLRAMRSTYFSPLLRTGLLRRSASLNTTQPTRRISSGSCLGSRHAMLLRLRYAVSMLTGRVRSFSQPWMRMMSSERPSENGGRKSSLDTTSTLIRKTLTSRLPTRENIYTIPNILTFTRLVAAPMIGYCILNSNHVMALSLFAYASITDLVDGYIARRFNQQTVVGTIIDPMADKILMTVGVICLAMKSAIPVWLAGLILARDVGLAISAIYYRWISLPPPKTMARYWDFSLPSAEVKPTQISKVNTALQLLLVGSAVAIPVIPEAVLSAWSVHEGMTGLQ
ncbi:conserved hypothetical protein [Uncinocarpus reesii 1704]|uniref:Phosphatidyl synthase n=1 Tax=Uncinocarpus reesii (strain UAMH 1704) TaxID=336963 RepID=C4JP29_UNCRE|nr:uncharacterized protein UREG_03088 [Uncinocarpus reesii 1704]EEP78243.1 conserved hypothetical protein [Uncinocarpus reesii 1704]